MNQLPAKTLVGYLGFRVNGRSDELDGYVEIGFPGRMIHSLKKRMSLKGRITVVNSAESFSDRVQWGSLFAPYDAFVPLNDYDLLDSSIDSSSVDLVSLFIGLHHCPQEKLEPFIASIHRVLREGGSFVLRDHNADSPEMLALVNVVHSVFNVATGVPWEGNTVGQDEASEVRNFQALSYWDNLLERYGFVRFQSEKLPYVRNGDPTENSLARYVKKKSAYQRELSGVKERLRDPAVERRQYQTYMTSLEWALVKEAKDYANFIEHTPFYDYRYFRRVGNLWKTFLTSWRSATKRDSRMDVIQSEYMSMNLFMLFFVTTEYSLKGIISWPISWFYSAESNQEVGEVSLIIYDPLENLAKTNDDRIIVDLVDYDSNYKRVILPRYLPFTDLLQKLAQNSVQFVSIAGNSHIQLDLEVPFGKDDLADDLLGSTVCGVIPDPDERGPTLVMLDVAIKDLAEVLVELDRREVRIAYIHDF
jgi:SAM-dependent methyltransferase